MNVTNTKGSTLGNSSAMARPIFVCPLLPYFIWDLKNPTSFLSFQFAITVTSIACPATTLLNILVILAVKKTKELKKNSNILLSSMAGADLLVGAVAMPLAITVCALTLQEHEVEDVICTIDYVSDTVMYAATGISISLLVLISWERYVAVAKWADYRTIVTRTRIKKYARIAWLVASFWYISVSIRPVYHPPYEAMVTMDVGTSLMGAFCLVLMVYYYIMVYRGVRKWNRSQIRQVQALVNAKKETKAASTAFLLTICVGISVVPIIMVFTFGEVWPSLRKSSFYRWSKTMLSLNSLFNPLLYCYRNRVFRKAVWKLLRSPGKSPRIQPVDTDGNQQNIKRARYGNSTALTNENKGDLETVELRHFRWTRSQSCGALKCLEQVGQRAMDGVLRPLHRVEHALHDSVVFSVS